MTEKGKNFSCSNTGKARAAEMYQTPPVMTEALIRLKGEELLGMIWDCACGKNAIVDHLKKAGFINVMGTDKAGGVDFLQLENDSSFRITIVTNPPYSIATQFVEKAIDLGIENSFFLMPFGFMQGQKRFNAGIYDHLYGLYPFTRMPMLSEEIREDGLINGTGMQTYAWYWFKSEKRKSKTIEVEWIDCSGLIAAKGELT